MRRPICILLLCVTLASPFRGHGAAPSLETSLARTLSVAFEWSPELRASRQQVAEFVARHEEVFAFYDPTVAMAACTAEQARLVPQLGVGYGLADNGETLEGGVEMPLRGGAYLAMGGAERYLRDAASTDSSLTQTQLAVEVRVPLLRDRGFRLFHLDEQLALAELNAIRGQYVDTGQRVGRDVAKAFVDVQTANSLWQVNRAATDRVRSLLAEAEELVRLKVVPEYQLHQARLEVSLSLEEETTSKANVEQAVLRLRRLSGAEEVEQVSSTDAFVAWAEQAAIRSDPELEHVLAKRGDFHELQARVAASRIQRAQADEELKSDLSLVVGTGWQGESGDGLLGSGHGLSEHNGGGSVMLTWSRPWGYRGGRARIVAAEAAEMRLQELVRDLREEIRAELAVTQVQFRSGRERLRLTNEAVVRARQTLVAESERFRLGEGRSRNVLDAQKDLTNTIRRQSRAAAAVLQARTDYQFATGLAGDTLLVPSKPEEQAHE